MHMPQSQISAYPISLQIRFHLLSGCASSGKFFNLLNFWIPHHDMKNTVCLPMCRRNLPIMPGALAWSDLDYTWLPLNNTSTVNTFLTLDFYWGCWCLASTSPVTERQSRGSSQALHMAMLSLAATQLRVPVPFAAWSLPPKPRPRSIEHIIHVKSATKNVIWRCTHTNNQR